MCHKTKTVNHEKNTKPRNAEIDPKEIAEPLPESTRERRDGPGGDQKAVTPNLKRDVTK